MLAAFALFALARSTLAEVLLAMAILGYGVVSFSAAMPSVILAVTPAGETSRPDPFRGHSRRQTISGGHRVHDGGVDGRRRDGRLGDDQSHSVTGPPRNTLVDAYL